MSKFFLFVICAIALIGCGGGGGGGSTTGGGGGGTVMDQFLAQLKTAVETEDSAALGSLTSATYLDDGTTKSQLLTAMGALFGDATNLQLTITVSNIVVTATTAQADVTTVSTYTSAMAGPQTVTDVSKFYLVLESGVWRQVGNQSAGGAIFNPTTYVGTYVGQWNNTTFGTSGSASFSVTGDLGTKTATMIMDLGGNVFGISDPDPVTLTGVWTDAGVTLTGASPFFGPASFTIDANGNFSGGFSNVPNTSIEKMEYTGTVNASSINLTYLITFEAGVGGGTASGTTVGMKN